jgi:polyhydroxybutyrate depolymerase
MLHGYGANGAVESFYLKLSPVTDAHGMLYVAPDGTIDKRGKRFWNATDACCNLYGVHVDDSAYLDGVIKQIEATYNVDRHRIFVVGHSNGGFMAYRMACDHADEVAAIVSLEAATFAAPGRCTPSRPVATLEIHGTADRTIGYRGGSIKSQRYPGAITTVRTWAKYDRCGGTPDNPEPASHLIEVGRPPATVLSYSTGCAPGGHVELWTQTGGVHAPRLTETFAEQVVDFLLAHPKP